jgi:hypothetical protein
MRKFLPLILILLLVSLSGCRLNATQSIQNLSPTLSDVQLQTQISTMLTVQPTATAAPIVAASPTPALPTAEALIPATVTPGEALPTATATQAAVASSPTPTPPPTLTPANPTPTPPPTLTPVLGPTATVSKDDPRPRQGSATSTDPMDNSTKWVWPTGVNDFTAIDFASGSMNLTSLKTTTGWRLANPAGEPFSNLYLEAVIKTGTCSGNDQYGVILRVPVLKDADQGYLFGFTCDGHYSLRLWDGTIGTKGQMTRLIDWTASKAIYTGSNQINRLGIMMLGGRMLLYANGTLLGEATNNTYSSGYFGLYIGGAQTTNFTIQVDEMSYWDNPKP